MNNRQIGHWISSIRFAYAIHQIEFLARRQHKMFKLGRPCKKNEKFLVEKQQKTRYFLMKTRIKTNTQFPCSDRR